MHVEVSPAEAADRLAIRELFDTYAHCADRRDAEGQKALFIVDTRFAVFMGGEGADATYVVEGTVNLAAGTGLVTSRMLAMYKKKEKR